MLALNLLPPEKKQEHRIAQIYTIIKNLIIIILLLTSFVAIALLAARGLLENHFNKTVAESTFTTRSTNIFSGEIKAFKQRLTAVDNIQKNHTNWTKFIQQFSLLVPSAVEIHTVSIHQAEATTITIAGFAETRAKLLEFQTNLEQSPLFPAEIEIPLSNLLTRENIDFSIPTTLNLEPLKIHE